MKKIILSFLFLPLLLQAQQREKVDFLTADTDIKFNLSERKVMGNVTYTFEVKTEIDTINIDAKNMHFTQVVLNGKKVNFKNNQKQLKLFSGYTVGKNTVNIQYEALPKQALYFIGTGLDLQIWTQGQGKYTSHWLPSFDDYNEKVIFSTKVTFDSDYHVVANGELEQKSNVGGQTTWTYKMNQPMASYLVMLAVGKYQVTTEKARSGVPIESFIRPAEASRLKNTYQHTKKMFDFLETEIGVPYPWKVYRNIPVEDFLYSGMENTTSTIFNQDFVVDNIGRNDRDYDNVNAHEMAHQWFGDLITAKENRDHWLQEGFATYYALLAERDIYGDNHYFWELYNMAENIEKENASSKNTVILSEGATTLTYYQKGAWALFALNSQIGADNFRNAVKNYLAKYAYKNVSTAQFLDEVEAVTAFNRQHFEDVWLKGNKFPIKEALYLLQNSPLISEYLALVEKQKVPFESKKEELLQILKTSAFEQVQQEVIYQLHKVPYTDAREFYDFVAQSKNIKVRQALVQIIEEIPTAFETSYKNFLNDESYITREMALKNLWYQKESYRSELLERTKTWVGFNDKNLRITWLMLALSTKGYHDDKKPHWYIELQNFSTSKFNSNVRQNAIQAMWFLNKYDSNVLPQLVGALVHPKSQFQKFGRDAITELIKRKEFKEYFVNLVPYLPDDEHAALKKLLHL